QFARATHRSGVAPPVVGGIIASQATRRARRAVADIVITNGPGCTLPALQAQVRQAAALFGL
ncbi:MAG: dephospho-CoA kinase, partial [Acidovorax sp.]